MKGSHILNFQELPRLRDSISYLYVEHAVIEKGDNAIVSISAEGRMPIPVSGVTCSAGARNERDPCSNSNHG